MSPDIDSAEVIDLTRRLVRIDSVSGHEGEIAGFIADYLTANGIATRISEAAAGRPNVYAQLGDARPGLLLNGHVDTVPIGNGWTRAPLGGEQDGGRIFGRGSADMKAELAAMMVGLVAARCHVSNPAGAVAFAAVVDEEVASLGTKAAIAAGITAPLAIIAEPTELQTICAAKGNCYFTITLRGRAAHAGSPELGVNAISAAAVVIRAIEQHDRAIAARRHPLLGRPYATVTRISGGTGESSVPDHCVLTVDRRLLPDETGESSRAELQALLGIEVALDMELPALDVAPDHYLVNEVRQTSIACGAPDRPVGGWSAACDGGHLQRAGVATVLFGPGSISGQRHRPDEVGSGR